MASPIPAVINGVAMPGPRPSDEIVRAPGERIVMRAEPQADGSFRTAPIPEGGRVVSATVAGDGWDVTVDLGADPEDEAVKPTAPLTGMTVGQLIARLREFPEDLPVVVNGYEGGHEELWPSMVEAGILHVWNWFSAPPVPDTSEPKCDLYGPHEFHCPGGYSYDSERAAMIAGDPSRVPALRIRRNRC